jgi:glycosyltransferase involved in cell wall biosynthesis
MNILFYNKKILVLYDNQYLTPRLRVQLGTMVKRKMRVTLMRWLRNQEQLSPESGWTNVDVYVPSAFGKASIILALPEVYLAMSRQAAKLEFDVIQVSSLSLLPLALYLSRKRRVPVIYDAYEFFTLHYARHLGPLGKYMSRFFEMLEDKMVARVNGCFCVDSQNKYIHKRYLRVNSNCEVLNNYPLTSHGNGNFDINKFHLDKETAYLAHIGDFRLFHAASQILEGFKIVRQRKDNVSLLLIGFKQANFAATDQLWQEAMQQQDVRIIPFLPYAEMIDLLKFTKLGFALIMPSGVYKNIGTGNSRKIYSYMEAGIPFLVSRHPMLKSLIKENGCGLVVDESDPEAIAAAVGFLLDHPQEAERMGARGREAFLQKYNWEKEEPKFWQVYQHAMNLHEGLPR